MEKRDKKPISTQAIAKKLIFKEETSGFSESISGRGAKLALVSSAPREKNEGMMPDMTSVKSKRILIVEDHYESGELLRMILEEEGYLVQAVETGGEAIERVAAASEIDSSDAPPDLILLDLRLPDMSGLDVVKELQRHKAAVPPVVFLSADPLQSLNHAADSVGASAVRKPFDFDDLLQAVELALANKS